MSADQAVAFADKVRAAYLEVYGTADVDAEADGELFMLGDVIVGISIEFADGDDLLIGVRHASRNAARGMAHQLRKDWTA